MSRTFLSASSEYLVVDTAPVASAPLSLACWFNATNITGAHNLVCLGHTSTNLHYWNIDARGDVGGDPVRAVARAGGGQVDAASSSGYSADTWHHVLGVFTATDDRHVLLDGGSKGTNAIERNPSLDRIGIAGLMIPTPQDFANASIAEVAAWNVALTDAEGAILAAGYSPLFVRPQNLVFYLPLVRDNDEDIVGGLSMSINGTPTVSAHPRIIYPSAPISGFGAAAAVAASIVVLRRRRSG